MCGGGVGSVRHFDEDRIGIGACVAEERRILLHHSEVSVGSAVDNSRGGGTRKLN